MKLSIHQNGSREEGSALMISMLIVALLGVSMGSYLALVSSQNHSVARSLAWASAVPAAEAGVEEALTHINRNGLSKLGEDGWVRKSDGWYQKWGNLGGGFAYVARISDADPPWIVSTGLAPTPLGPSAIDRTEAAVLAAAADQRWFVRRSVHVQTFRERSFFAKGIVAKGRISLNGNNVTADSFDSDDPNYSENGTYDPDKAKDNGDVATNSGLVGALDTGNADILGAVATGAGGAVDIGPNGVVGDADWHVSPGVGIQPERYSSDMNVSFPDVIAPFTTGPIPVGGRVDDVEYDIILDDGDWVISNLSGSVLVRGNARLYVSNSIDVKGEGVILEKDASLKLYSAAPSVSITGNLGVNVGGLAKNLQYFGLPENKEIRIAGNGEFVGVIYAPNAHLHLAGGGNNELDFMGASISNTVQVNGKFQFHYDEALARLDDDSRGYLPNSWNEIDISRALPPAAYSSDPGEPLVVYY
jgi:hypothetical protein